MNDELETIFAVSSGIGKSAVAVVRISGPACRGILDATCRGAAFKDREAKLVTLRDREGETLDRGLVIAFSGPRSYTGEDMIEFQVTGSRAVLSGLLSTLAACPNCRPAEPGEFARRAFENGKLDLVEVEGVASIVEAETSAQLRHALAFASGAVSRRCEEVRALVLRASAEVESLLDFSDVEDAATLSIDHVFELIEEAETLLSDMLERSRVSERLRVGMSVAIAGAPNAGKSTLLNHLAQREVAIVSPIPGTTRDILEVAVDAAGFPIVFFDTAGLRESADSIEAEGVRRALDRASRADLILWLSEYGEFADRPAEFAGPVIKVRTKSDLTQKHANADGLAISVMTGQGIPELLAAVVERARQFFVDAGDIALNTERQRAAVRETLLAIADAKKARAVAVELCAEDLRRAGLAVGRITGHIGVEEVLNEVFSRLCVGK